MFRASEKLGATLKVIGKVTLKVHQIFKKTYLLNKRMVASVVKIYRNSDPVSENRTETVKQGFK